MADKIKEEHVNEQLPSVDAVPTYKSKSANQIRQSEFPEQGDMESVTSMATGSSRQTGSFGNIPDPPADWHFNILLQKLGDSLSAEDLHNMKSLFHGDGGIGRGVLEKMKTPLEFFRILRTRGFIARDNLLYLQAILFWAGRKDLVQEAIKYSKTVGEVLHFYSPIDEPENGYRYVKFHVDGRDFSNFAIEELDHLRLKVAKLLFVPQNFIFIRGVEPSSSLVITLMIPEMYVDILQDLLTEGEDFVGLQDMGIDTVEVDGKTAYNIKGSCRDVVVETEQQTKFVNVYEQLQQTKSRLDDTEVEYLEISRQVDILQSELNATQKNLRESVIKVNALETVLSSSMDGKQPATLKELSSLREFTDALHQINLEAVDRKIIQRMLNATVNIVSTRMRESNRILEQKMLLDLQEMQSKLDPLIFQLERYKFLTDISDMDEAISNNLQVLLQSIFARTQVHGEISLSQHGIEMMKKVSSKLRPREKEKLKQKYRWNSEGEIEKSIEEDRSLFLVGLYDKEIEQKRAFVLPEVFIAQCLTEVGRDDLKKFLEPKPTAAPSSPRYNAAEAKQKHDGQQSHNQQQQQQHQQRDQTITRMAEQIQEMYDMLKTKQGAYASKYEAWKTPSFPFDQASFQSSFSM